MKRTMVMLGLLALAGCGGDNGGTGPSEEVTLDGQWSAEIFQVNGTGSDAGVQCRVENLVMTVSQSGTTFGGSHSGGTLICVSGSIEAQETIGPGSVTGATVTGDDVVFLIGGIQLVGEWDGNLITGSTSTVLGGIPYSGPFRFER